MPRPRVVILGGGFAGLATAQALDGADLDVVVVDRRNHHLFQPLLYQVATASLAPSDIAEPIRHILARQANASVRMATAVAIDLPAQEVHLEGGDRVAYDHLVVAAGARHSYFGNDAWADHAPGLKTIGDALEIRRRVLSAFEAAEWCDDPEERRALTTFVVVGAGPTGVELAGALAEIAMRTLRRDFRRVDTTQARVVLVEGSHAVLPPYPEVLQGRARQQLEGLGVEVRLDTKVTGIDAEGVDLGDERLEARTVLWAAGVEGAPVGATLGVPMTRNGQIEVQPDLSVPGHPEVFVIGDLARVPQPDGSVVPGVAPAAQQMGRFVGATLRDDLAGRPRGAFRYVDKGSMATIGRSRAVMDALGMKLGGFPAWLAWVLVHLLFLVTFRNRVLVFTKWAWAWFTWERASRLVWQGEGHPSQGASGEAHVPRHAAGPGSG